MSSIILTGFDLTYRCTGKEMSYQHTHWRDVEVVCTYYRLSLVGLDGKIFGSRSTYGSRLARFVIAMTLGQIFSRPTRSNSVIKHVIIWYIDKC